MTAPDNSEHSELTAADSPPPLRNLDHILARLKRSVFDSDDPVVVALKGGWGEGKTHFWKNDVVNTNGDEQIGYVSLFGATSLQEIRERVVLATTPSFTLDKSQSGNTPTFLDRIKRWGNTIKGHLPEAISLLGLPENLTTHILEEELLKPGWVICLDDMERLSESIEPKALLGYIAELRDRRGLKIVLIYNQDRLEKKDQAFLDFQEKVIDKEIPFSPDIKDILQLVFGKVPTIGQKEKVMDEVERCCQVLGLRNIRLLKKIRHYYEDILHELPDNPNTSFLDQVLYSLILFVWIRFAKHDDEHPTFELLLNDSEFYSYFGDDIFEEDDQTDKHKKARELLSEFGYKYSDDLDRILMDFIQTDELDHSKLLQEYERHTNETSRGLLESQYRGVWKKYYHGTLQDTEEEFCSALTTAATDFIDFIPINNLDETLSILSQLDNDEEAKKLLDMFLAKRADKLNDFSSSDLMEPVNHPALKTILDKIEKTGAEDNRPIGEVIDSAFQDEWPSFKDRERLAQFTSQEFVDYLTANDQMYLTSKLRRLGTMSSKIANPSANDIHVQQTVRQAAADISAQNRMNRFRMESMGLITKDEPNNQEHAGE